MILIYTGLYTTSIWIGMVYIMETYIIEKEEISTIAVKSRKSSHELEYFGC